MDSKPLNCIEQENGSLKINNAKNWWAGFNRVLPKLEQYGQYKRGIPSEIYRLNALASKTTRDENVSFTDAAGICNVLLRIWELLPNDPSVLNLPDWSIFCDLCSERYLVDGSSNGEN